MLYELIKTMDYGVSYGSGALKALQNESLPEIDLLVREAIQNSSDAALGLQDKSFAVNFTVNSFHPNRLNALLPSLTKLLDERYGDKEQTFIEIRDFRTCGLTGPVRLSELNRDDHGNYFKLVFDTGKEQTSSNMGEAGGSWGYGKSVYYRVGIGLVILYSQIKTGSNSYEERMVFSLTEHETDEKSLLKEIRKDSIGRAWWGKKDQSNEKELIPISDPDEIKKILDIFNLTRFKSKQTGTAIIVPYVDSERLLAGIFPDDCGVSDIEKSMCTWKDSVTEYLRLAIEKWYAPKVFNKALEELDDQKWLAVRVNGSGITKDDMRPFFQLVQELYTTSLYRCFNKAYTSALFKGIECIPVPSQRIEGQKSGYVSFVRINQGDLSKTGSMIKPYVYLRLFGRSALNDPIVMFARTPGMVLDYKIDGKWSKGLIKPENDDEYILAFYVPNCSLSLKKDKALGEFSGKSFGEYLRKCEKSDHMDWEDKSNLTIIQNIKTQVVSKINNSIKSENSELIEGTISKLSGKLGRRLLPPIDYGRKSGSGSIGDGSHSGSLDNLVIELSPKIRHDGMEIEFKITFKNNRKSSYIGVFVESENGVIDADTWEDKIGRDFPIKLVALNDIATILVNERKEFRFKDKCTYDSPKTKNRVTEIELLMTKSGEIVRGFRILNTQLNCVVTGTMLLKTNNRKCVCTIKEMKN